MNKGDLVMVRQAPDSLRSVVVLYNGPMVPSMPGKVGVWDGYDHLIIDADRVRARTSTDPDRIGETGPWEALP